MIWISDRIRTDGCRIAALWWLITCVCFLGACSKEGDTTAAAESSPSGFTLSSPEVAEGGMLPVDYTCDGTSSTLPLKWSGAPQQTQSFALIMHHVASPTDIHWYWVLYNIPATIDSLPKNVGGVGKLGNNSVNGRVEYAPPCSKGPGPKVYTYTVYALSTFPVLTVPDSLVSREALLQSIEQIVLDSAMLHVVYSR